MSFKKKSKKKSRYLLPLLIVFFILLRFIHLDQSFWLDETIQASVSQKGLNYYLSSHLKNDFNPPLFYLLTILWSKIFPINEVLFRIPSIVFFTLSSFLVYNIAKTLNLPKKKRLLTLFLILSSPLLLYYSQEARPYMMATCTTLASTFFFLKFIKNKEKKDLFSHSLFLTISIFTHYTTLLLIPAYLFYLLLTKNQKLIKTYLLSWILPTLIFLFYSPIFLSQLKHSQSAHQLYPGWFMVIGKTNLKSIFLLFTKFIIGRVSFLNKMFYLFLALLLIPLYWLPAIKRKQNHPLFLFLLVPPLLGFLISFKSPIFDYFRFLYCLPYLYLLIAKNSHPDLSKLLIFINLSFSLFYLFTPSFHREDWKGYCHYLKTNYPDTPILILEAVDTPLSFYCPHQSIIKINPQNVQEKLENQNQIILTNYALPIFDPENKIENTILKNHHPQKTQNFNLIQFVFYTQK